MSETQLIRCPACGVVNRVPLDKVALGLTPVCGRCKTRMPVTTLLVLKEGREVDRIVGLQSKSEIARRLEHASD